MRLVFGLSGLFGYCLNESNQINQIQPNKQNKPDQPDNGLLLLADTFSISVRMTARRLCLNCFGESANQEDV